MPHVISAVRPAWAVPGAPVSIDGVHLPVPADGPPHVLVGAVDARVTRASHRSVRIVVPPESWEASGAPSEGPSEVTKPPQPTRKKSEKAKS